MAIAIDNQSQSHTDGASSLTWSHQCSGSNPLLIVGFQLQAGRSVSSVTYNGVNMVQINANATGGSVFSNVYLYRNDTSQVITGGTYNIVITGSASGYIYADAASYTGVDQTNPINANTIVNQVTQTSSITATLTTSVDQCWLVGHACHKNDGSTFTAGANTTLRIMGWYWNAMLDSNGARSTGSNSITANGNIDYLAFNIAALTPVQAGGTTTTTTTTTVYIPTFWQGINHYWKLDETSGTSMSDSVGNSTLTAGGTINQTGKNNVGVLCNDASGNSIYTDLATNDFEKNQPFSYSFWFKKSINNTDTFGFISRLSRASGIIGYNIAMTGGNTIYIEMLGGIASNGYYINKTSNAVAPTDTTTFHHFVFTYDGSMNASGVKFYIDGGEITLNTNVASIASATTMIPASARYRIGNYEAGYPANGVMDEVCSFTRELSASDVTKLFKSGTGLFFPDVPSLSNGFFQIF